MGPRMSLPGQVREKIEVLLRPETHPDQVKRGEKKRTDSGFGYSNITKKTRTGVWWVVR